MIYPKQAIGPVQLTTAYAVYYTVPAGASPESGLQFIPTAWTFYNADAGPAAVLAEICIVPTAGTPGAANRFVKKSIAVDQTWTPWELLRQPLPAGTMIQMKADKATSINVMLGGYLQTAN